MPARTMKNQEKARYLKLEILIPIIISVISLLYSIYNGYITEHLSRDVYVPRLEAKFETKDSNIVLVDIQNNGLAAAQNIVAEVNWYHKDDLSNCTTEPPYQDLQPIKPLVNQNYSYRLLGLPIDGEFIISCQLNVVSATDPATGQQKQITLTSFQVKITADNTKPETSSFPIFRIANP
jgi:hypothetical protein